LGSNSGPNRYLAFGQIVAVGPNTSGQTTPVYAYASQHDLQFSHLNFSAADEQLNKNNSKRTTQRSNGIS